MAEAFTSFYPEIEPFQHGMLQVSPVHAVYYEQCGNPNGYPILFVHGGPGGGCQTNDRRFFDPSFFRIILIDQRGAGRSKPFASLEDNTTWHLVEDLERLRIFLGINKWAVFGGSWGSTLSLTYAETHPDRVKALILRGIFTLRRKELLFFYQSGADFLFPDAWESYVAPIPENERHDMMDAYYRRLTGPNEAERLACAKAWSTWEMATCKLRVDPEVVAKGSNPNFALAFARVECHYFVNRGFFERDDQIIANVDRIRHIPAVIVQGRYDVVCPMRTAWDLHRAWPEANFHVIDAAGHSSSEPGVRGKLVEATNNLRDQLAVDPDAIAEAYGATAGSSVTAAAPAAGPAPSRSQQQRQQQQQQTRFAAQPQVHVLPSAASSGRQAAGVSTQRSAPSGVRTLGGYTPAEAPQSASASPRRRQVPLSQMSPRERAQHQASLPPAGVMMDSYQYPQTHLFQKEEKRIQAQQTRVQQPPGGHEHNVFG